MVWKEVRGCDLWLAEIQDPKAAQIPEGRARLWESLDPSHGTPVRPPRNSPMLALEEGLTLRPEEGRARESSELSTSPSAFGCGPCF